MSESGVEQEIGPDVTVEVLKKKGKQRKGRPRKAANVIQTSDIPTTQQLMSPKSVQAPSLTVPQGAQTLVQPLQTLYQPLQAVLHPQHTILPSSHTTMPQPPQTVPHPPHTVFQPQQPPQVLLQPPQTVLHPQQAVLQTAQTVLQHPSVTPQPPKPGFTDNSPPSASFVSFSGFPNTFSSPVLNSAVQAPVQQAIPTSVSNNSQTSTMSLLNALHDEKLGLLLPVIVRMEHKMDQLMAMLGQMGSQLNSIIIGNQSQASLTGQQSNTVIMRSQSNSTAAKIENQGNAAMLGKQLNAKVTGKQSNNTIMGMQSNVAMLGHQSDVAVTRSQSDATITGSQSNLSVMGSQSNTTMAEIQNGALTIENPVNIPLESNNDVDHTNTRQSSPSVMETHSNYPMEGSQESKDQKNSQQLSAGSSNLPAFYLSKEYLVSLKAKSSSVKNFAVRLMRELFTSAELEGKNISGSRGKDQVDPERIKMIKEIVFNTYDTLPADREIEWRNCRKAMDSFLRSKKHKHELESSVRNTKKVLNC